MPSRGSAARAGWPTREVLVEAFGEEHLGPQRRFSVDRRVLHWPELTRDRVRQSEAALVDEQNCEAIAKRVELRRRVDGGT